jgi:hypothetical protein
MTSEHDALYEKALYSIERLFMDNTVDREQTRKSLQELQGEINLYLSALDADDRRDAAAELGPDEEDTP